MKRLIKNCNRKEFNVGDRVIYKTHPYDNTTIFTIREILNDNTYFIENNDKAYTNINGINLEKIEE